MKYIDLTYREYIHKLLVFEVDDLTEDCKEYVEVSQEDCFMMCTNFIDDQGDLIFVPLAIGKSAKTCNKMLDAKAMMTYSSYFMANFEVTKVEKPSKKVLSLSDSIIKENENCSEALKQTRDNIRLDDVRLPYAPDLFRVGFINDNEVQEYIVRATNQQGPFIEGTLYDDPIDNLGIERGDRVKALPYFAMGSYHFLAILLSDGVSDEDGAMLEEFLTELSQGLVDAYETNQKKS